MLENVLNESDSAASATNLVTSQPKQSRDTTPVLYGESTDLFSVWLLLSWRRLQKIGGGPFRHFDGADPGMFFRLFLPLTCGVHPHAMYSEGSLVYFHASKDFDHPPSWVLKLKLPFYFPDDGLHACRYAPAYRSILTEVQKVCLSGAEGKGKAIAEESPQKPTHDSKVAYWAPNFKLLQKPRPKPRHMPDEECEEFQEELERVRRAGAKDQELEDMLFAEVGERLWDTGRAYVILLYRLNCSKLRIRFFDHWRKRLFLWNGSCRAK